MFEIFSTREVVGAFYFILFMIFMLSKKELRAGIVKVIKCACNIKLVIPFFILLVYISAFICIFMRTTIWNNVYIKDIVMWFLFIGVPYVYNAASDGEKKHYFVGLFLSNIKLLVVLEFFFGTFTFSIITELIMQPILTFLILLQAVAETKEEWKSVVKLLDVLLGITGFVILGFTVRSVMGNYQDVDPIATLISFCIPIVFSILFVPCAYILAVYAKYENVFTRIDFVTPAERKIRSKRYRKIFGVCGLSFKKLCEFYKEYIRKMYLQMSDKEFDEIIEDFKNV